MRLKKTGIFCLLISFLILGSAYSAFSETTTFQSPLIYHGLHESPKAIETDGQIQTITANWKFKGKVTLKVSADNGLHYTPVVNGVPLIVRGPQSTVHGGNKIKWKASIGPDSELSEVKIVYTDTSGVAGTFGEPELSGFKFRRSVSIQNPSQQELFNYQMRIKVAEEKGVVRFTAADGETLLPYCLEDITGTPPNRVATFWVKIPQLPKEGGKIYIYYGNNQAEDLSNGEEVFDFFDDFKGKGLDQQKWEIRIELGGDYNLSNSQLTLKDAEIISKDYQLKDGILEYRAKTGYEARAIIRGRKEASELTQVAYSSAYKGAEHSIVIGDIVEANDKKPVLPDMLYDYRIITRGENITFERYARGRGEYPVREATVRVKSTGGLTKGYIGLKTGARVEQDRATYYDWLRVRKFVRPEPIVGSQGKEELTNLAQFSGKVYISKIIPTPYQTRIMVPSWTTEDGRRRTEEGLVVDISADNGAAYKTDCAAGSYYYASREDFTAGRNLKFRLELEEISDSELAEISVQRVTLDYYPGNILIISPNGGESWKPGTFQKVLWLALEYEPTYPMRIEYSLDGGKTYDMIKEKRENIGVYFWMIPRKLSGKKLIIKVSDGLDERIYDTSNGVLQVR